MEFVKDKVTTQKHKLNKLTESAVECLNNGGIKFEGKKGDYSLIAVTQGEVYNFHYTSHKKDMNTFILTDDVQNLVRGPNEITFDIPRDIVGLLITEQGPNEEISVPENSTQELEVEEEKPLPRTVLELPMNLSRKERQRDFSSNLDEAFKLEMMIEESYQLTRLGLINLLDEVYKTRSSLVDIGSSLVEGIEQTSQEVETNIATTVEEAQPEFLKEIGKWIEKNKEAIATAKRRGEEYLQKGRNSLKYFKTFLLANLAFIVIMILGVLVGRISKWN